MSQITADIAESRLFDEVLACRVDLPAAFVRQAPESGTVERAIARTEALLHAIARIEDSHGEDSDEGSGKDLALQRVEAKLDLMLELLGKIARRGMDALPLLPLRWSRHGVELLQPVGALEFDRGFLLLQATDWLPSPLELPVKWLAGLSSSDGRQRALLQFDPLPSGLEAAIERHLFRLHRRQIAHSRQRHPPG